MVHSRRWLGISALTATIFVLNSVPSLHDALAVLYLLVILVVARSENASEVLGIGCVCAVLALISFFLKHLGEPLSGAYVRLGVSEFAIGVTTLLSHREHATRALLSEQSVWLALTHDTVIIRDSKDIIIDWNEGASKLYGWSRAEALGKTSASLLQTEFHDTTGPDLVAGAFWEGVIKRRKRDGTLMTLTSRWRGRVSTHGGDGGIIELSADLTSELRARADQAKSEQRYKAIFDGAAVAIFEFTVSGTTREIALSAYNTAAARLFHAEDGGSISPFTDMKIDGHASFRHAVLYAVERNIRDELQGSIASDSSTLEREFLITVSPGYAFSGGSTVLVTVVDISEQNRTRRRIEQMQADLSHASRISALGQMTALIAHEVNQPLMATLAFARSGRRWLRRETPDMREVEMCLDGIVETGERAARVIEQVRLMSRKTVTERERLGLRTIVNEALEMLASECRRNGVRVENTLPRGAVWIIAARTQIHQVLVNVILNAVQAMAAMPAGPRVLTLEGGTDEARAENFVLIKDTGPGFAEPAVRSSFQPFLSSRQDGVGLGLSVCQTIMEAHDGRIEGYNLDSGGGCIKLRWPKA